MATVPSPATVAALAKVTAGWGNSSVRDIFTFLMSTRQIVYLNQASAQSAVVASTFTDILFDQEAIDRDGQHSTVTNTNRITIGNTLGWYLVLGIINYPGNNTGNSRRAQIALNNVAVNGTLKITSPLSSTFMSVMTWGLVQSTAAADYITLQAWHDATSSLVPSISGAYRSTFGAVWLGT